MDADEERERKQLITPERFQEICDQAMLAVDWKNMPADASPYKVTRAVIIEIHKSVCHHLGKAYSSTNHQHLPPNEQWIEEIIEMVSKNWSSPILVESSVRETANIALEHWRHSHSIDQTGPVENESFLGSIMKFIKEKRKGKI